MRPSPCGSRRCRMRIRVLHVHPQTKDAACAARLFFHFFPFPFSHELISHGRHIGGQHGGTFPSISTSPVQAIGTRHVPCAACSSITSCALPSRLGEIHPGALGCVPLSIQARSRVPWSRRSFRPPCRTDRFEQVQDVCDQPTTHPRYHSLYRRGGQYSSFTVLCRDGTGRRTSRTVFRHVPFDPSDLSVKRADEGVLEPKGFLSNSVGFGTSLDARASSEFVPTNPETVVSSGLSVATP